MTRASRLIAAFESRQQAAVTPAPVLTADGVEAVKDVNALAKAQLHSLNPALKWDWVGAHPSPEQRKSDNFEWTLSVNTESHGTELVDQVVAWAEGTLRDKVARTFADGPTNVTVSVEDNTFPDDETGATGPRFVNVLIRLHDMQATGLLVPKGL